MAAPMPPPLCSRVRAARSLHADQPARQRLGAHPGNGGGVHALPARGWVGLGTARTACHAQRDVDRRCKHLMSASARLLAAVDKNGQSGCPTVLLHAVWTQVAAPSLLERLLDLFVCANLFLQATSPSLRSAACLDQHAGMFTQPVAPPASCQPPPPNHTAPSHSHAHAHARQHTRTHSCKPTLVLIPRPGLQCCAVYAVSPSVIHAYQVHRAEEDMWWWAHRGASQLHTPA
jgi:hypothetical protein